MPTTCRSTTYRSLFRTPEFTPLFLASSAQVAAQTMRGLALGTLVYRATDSPLLSALSMFGPSLAQLLGATTLLSAADRLAPRATMTGRALAFAAGTALLALPAPLWTVFALVLTLGLVASLGGGVRWGLLNEILPKDAYIVGRSVFNMANGITQITGYATGGVLITLRPGTWRWPVSPDRPCAPASAYPCSCCWRPRISSSSCTRARPWPRRSPRWPPPASARAFRSRNASWPSHRPNWRATPWGCTRRGCWRCRVWARRWRVRWPS